MLTKSAYSFSPEEQSVIDKAQNSLDLNYNNNNSKSGSDKWDYYTIHYIINLDWSKGLWQHWYH